MNGRVYIAAPWVRRREAIEIGRQFEAAGFEITSRWFHHEGSDTDPAGLDYPIEHIRNQAREDIADVMRADALVVVNLQKSEGKAVETGVALANGIPVVSVGQRSNIFQTLGTQVASVAEAIEYLLS